MYTPTLKTTAMKVKQRVVANTSTKKIKQNH